MHNWEEQKMKKYTNPTLQFVMLSDDEIICESGVSTSSSISQFGGSLPGDSHVDFKDLLSKDLPC